MRMGTGSLIVALPALIFGYPLMAGNPRPYSDRILWVVASPRDGIPLRLTGHPLNAVKPVVMLWGLLVGFGNARGAADPDIHCVAT
jgi:hypothetical protein